MGGACCSGDTLITLTDGTYMSIKQLVEEQKIKQLPCIDIDTGKIKIGNISQYCDIGERNTIKIITDKGNSLEGTYEHPIIVQYINNNTKCVKWQRLDKLHIGDNIAVPKVTSYFGSIHNPDARLLGILIGDGSYTAQYVSVSTKDDEIYNYLQQYDKDMYITRQFNTKTSENFREIRLHKQILQIVKTAGIHGQSSIKKTLPINWQKWDKESLANLVAGLFDTNGNLYMSNKKSPIILYASICKNIVDDLKLILLKFGIHSSIQIRAERTHNMPGNRISTSKQYYVLKIMGQENIINFAKNINLLIKYRRDYLVKMVQWFKNKKIKLAKQFIDTDLRFEKVVTIEYGKTNVYDLTVDKYHSFITNNIFSHNTNAKIIQIGTPKTRNHFYEAIEGRESDQWFVVRKDWSQCEQLWALSATYLPDHEDPTHKKERPYSTFVLSLMPKSLKQEYFPTCPEIWTEGSMSVEDFKTQYMLQFVDGDSQFLSADEIDKLKSGDFEWQDHSVYGEKYVAGIDFAGSSAGTADFTHISILRIDPLTLQKQKIFAIEMNGVSYPEQINIIDDLFGGYNPKFPCQAIFADFTGCGRPVVQTLIEERGIKQITGITFNATDTFTHTGMNLKNAMFTYAKQEINYERFKYPSLDNYLKTVPKDQVGFWHKMIGEWSDLVCEQKISINKRIASPLGGHDDVPCADILGVYASIVGAQGHRMPKPVVARLSR